MSGRPALQKHHSVDVGAFAILTTRWCNRPASIQTCFCKLIFFLKKKQICIQVKLNKTPVLESTCTTLPIGRTKYIKNTGYNDTTAGKRHEVNHCARYSSVVIYLFIHHLYPELCVVATYPSTLHTHVAAHYCTVVRLYATCEHHLPVIIESCNIS